MTHNEPINEHLNILGAFRDAYITSNSSLIAGAKIAGVDPIGASQDKLKQVAALYRAIVQLMPESATLYQYYCHHKTENYNPRTRDDERVNAIVNRRANHLNRFELAESSIYHFIELPTPSNLNKFTDIRFLTDVLSCVFDKAARKRLRAVISEKDAILFHKNEFEDTLTRLHNELTTYTDKLSLISFENTKLQTSSLWSFMRYLVNLDHHYLSQQEAPPIEAWNETLSTGEIESVVINGVSFLKISGAKTIYARIGSVLNYGGEYTPLAAFSKGDKPAVLCDGNYIIQQRWRPLPRLKRASMIRSRTDDINRKTIKLTSLVSGSDVIDESRLSDYHKDLLKELKEVASNDTVKLGQLNNKVVVYDELPENVNKWVDDINLRLSSNGIFTIWESASLKEAFKSIWLAGDNKHPRSHTANTSHVGALGLLYQTSEGSKHWRQTGIDEECLIYLQTADNKLFGFNPFVGGKCVVICVGPIRSGKSFTRATLASHNMKYGGYHLSVDVDAGSESLVEYFSDYSSLFKVTDDPNSGFNLLAAANGIDDKTFIEHFYKQIEALLQLNSSEDLRKLTVEEQKDLDHALTDILRQPKERQTLSNLVIHLQTQAADKLARFVQGGLLGNFFDSRSDSSASITTRLSAFNLEAIKDNEALLPIVMRELFFRANRLFENPEIRTVPKILDIDESHVLLGMPDAGSKIVSAARRIGKYFGGIWLWSQNPEEYAKCQGWDALRTAASALLFMPDSEMDSNVYKSTFNLTDGECERIAKLTPKKQFYLVQRDLGISTVVDLNVDAAQFVINASQSMERDIREKAFKMHPNDINKALQHAAKEMGVL